PPRQPERHDAEALRLAARQALDRARRGLAEDVHVVRDAERALEGRLQPPLVDDAELEQVGVERAAIHGLRLEDVLARSRGPHPASHEQLCQAHESSCYHARDTIARVTEDDRIDLAMALVAAQSRLGGERSSGELATHLGGFPLTYRFTWEAGQRVTQVDVPI